VLQALNELAAENVIKLNDGQCNFLDFVHSINVWS